MIATIRTACLCATTAVAVLISLLGLAAAPAAQAGDFVVNGTCGTWTAFNNQPDRLASYPECAHLRARNIVGKFTTPANPAGAGWRFNAPPGTTIRAVKVDGYITGGASWWSQIKVMGGPGEPEGLLAGCFGQDPCGKGTTSFSVLPDLRSVVATVWCQDGGGCPNSGTRPRGSIDIASSAITLHDPSPPATSIVGGSLSTPGWHGGNRTVAVAATDNTGIRAARALVDGDPRHSSTNSPPCDFARAVPCSNQPAAEVAVDLRGLPDGQHALQAQAEDASGNGGTSPVQMISVDNTPPLAPNGARLTGGVGWRAANNFTVAWTNPLQAHAPIAGVGYTLCPQGQPDSSPACRTGSLGAADISQLAFKVPGPGAWRMRLWLVDSAGNGAPENGVTISGLGLLAGRKGHAPTQLKAGRRVGRELKRRPRIALGKRARIVGRLSAGKRQKGIRRTLLVYRRVSVQGAQFKPVGRIKTSKRGRFAYRAGPGPSRRLLFVYPGNAKTAGRIAAVQLRVKAKLSIGTDRKKLRNGDTVMISGRLKGGQIPAGGTLLTLQVFTRDRWRPFATPRADKDGRWSYGYRFETVTGNARFRFRAVLRKQPTYPYTARSRAAAVRVRG